jgi:hypothetical protein
VLSFSCYFSSVCFFLSFSIRQFSSVQFVLIARDISVGSISCYALVKGSFGRFERVSQNRKGVRG